LVIFAQLSTVLDSGDLITRRAIVFRNFGFNNYSRIEFAEDNEIRGLIEILCPVGHPKSYFGTAENILNVILETISYKFTVCDTDYSLKTECQHCAKLFP
jgi:hypothetical protein